MKLNDLTDMEVPALLQFLRDNRILHFRNGDVALTLSERHSEVNSEGLPSNWEDESKKFICPCEHEMAEHNDLGECLNGCDIERCNNKEE